MSMMTIGAAAWLRTGGDTPVSPFDPSTLSGLTFAFSAQSSPMYKGISTSDGESTLENDSVLRVDSLNGISRCFSTYLDSDFLLKKNSFGEGLPAISGSGDIISYARPSGSSAPATAVYLSTLFSAGTKLVLWAGTVDSASSDLGQPWSNDAILADWPGYCGLHCYQAGGNIVYQWYNWAVSDNVASSSAPAGQPVVLACRHDSGALRMAVNGVSWGTAVGSGNTASMGSQLSLGRSGSGISFRTAAFVTCRTSNSDSDILDVVKQMGGLVGLHL